MIRALLRPVISNALAIKRVTSHLLTPTDIKEKTRLTASFLKRKIAEHDNITEEIERLKYDVQ